MSTLQVNTIQTNTPAGVLAVRDINNALTSIQPSALRGTAAATAPIFQDSAGTQIGTLCRAWVNFNGTGTIAIRAAFNVSSITDIGVGRYQVNFTNALSDANYALTGLCKSNTGVDWARLLYDGNPATTNSGEFVATSGSTNTFFDSVFVFVAVFR